MQNYIWMAIAGGIATLVRFWLSGYVAHRFGESFPFGTLIINVSGSFGIGVFAALTSTEGVFW